jgi:hypothetical protein
LNEIGLVDLETHRPLFFDAYSRNRATGSFILIDPLTNETVAGGMIVSGLTEAAGQGRVTASERRARFGHSPAVVVVNTEDQAYALERYLFERGCQVHVTKHADAVPELMSAGLVVVLHGASGGALDGIRELLLRPASGATPAEVWTALAAAGITGSGPNLGGDGI